MLQAIILNEEIGKISAYKDNGERCSFLMESFISGSDYMKSWNELYEMTKIKKEEIMEIAKEFLDKNRVEIYKKQGIDTTVRKVEKPTIHQVELNRGKQSDFVKNWNSISTNSIAPVYANFETDIKKSEIGPAKFLYVKNKDNRLFTMHYWFDYGNFHSKTLSFALKYLKFLGTSTKSAEEISKELYMLGCSFNTYPRR